MTCVQALFTNEFKKQMSKIKDQATLERLRRAVENVLASPEKGKFLGGALTGKKSIRLTPFRLVFEVLPDGVVFHTFEHRKWAYR